MTVECGIILRSVTMENPVCSAADGKVIEIKIKEKDKIDKNQVLMIIGRFRMVSIFKKSIL